MLKKIRLSLLALLITGTALAQSTGSIIFSVVDDNNQPLPFVNIAVLKGGAIMGSGQTDFDGRVEVKPLDPGKYDVKAVLLNFHDFNETGVDVVPNAPTHLTVKMIPSSKELPQVVIKYQKPAVDVTGHVGGSVDKTDIDANADKANLDDIIGTMTGFSHTDLGQPLHASGTRTEDNQYIIDGVKVSADLINGNPSNGGVPQGMVGEINTYISGVPAKYGDATGGIIEINTIQASPKFFGSVEGITSELLDPYGYNDINFALGGPIWSKRDSNHKKVENGFPSLNFVIGGEYTYQYDQSPNYIGGYYVNQSTLNSLEENPIIVNPLGGFNRAAEYITDDNIYHTAALQNNALDQVQGNGHIDVRINPMVTITVGGSYQYTEKQDNQVANELFNSSENPLHVTNASRFYVRLKQSFNTAPDKNGKHALIQNAYYTLQANYSNTYDVLENPYFKDNYFDYGYVGQFNTEESLNFGDYTWKQGGAQGPGYYQTAVSYSAMSFTPGTLNPYLANYTNDVYNSIGEQNIYYGLGNLEENQGLMNGESPTNVYSLWYNVGQPWGQYYKDNDNHFQFKANFSATILNNDFQVGFEYEQNIMSYYTLSAQSLWTLMRQNTVDDYQKVFQLDTNTHDAYAVPGQNGYFNEPFIYNSTEQTQIDKSILQKLGLPVSSSQYIFPDNYAPSFYSLSMFSASDLLNSGSQLVNYYGYTYTGQQETGTPTIDDFFNQRDANGNNTYPVAPYHPIYMAGYIQDHFDYKSLRFDIGLRVDRFDANQPVLKDPYLYFPAKDVAEVRDEGGALAEQIPASVNGNDVVYVNNANSPTSIVGFRNGSYWYNSSGDAVADPTVLANISNNGTIQPYLENPNQQAVGADAFTTYTPQVNLNPRIAFSFPISDMAGFFAHYDILTSRPPGYGYNIFNPFQYLYYNSYSNIGTALQNSALNPEQTTDYELGYTQALNEKKTTALTISAFYRAPRSEIESYRYLDAYPIGYIAYNNIDFGTIKGLTLAYTLSRIGDFKMRASYTLQFADGTGSGPNSGYNLANSGEPNLEIPLPLSFDQRHNIQVNFDYHFLGGQYYDGPIITSKGGNNIAILSDAGVNVNFVATSGTPYTVQGNATEGNPSTQNVAMGIAQHYTLVGSVNGSNLPWQYRIDLRVDKDFPLEIKRKDKESHKCDVMVYLSVTNLLNTENILNVYAYTGSATDDGFLASAQGQLTSSTATSPQAFIDQYKIKVQDPTYLSQPRTIRLGLNFNF